MRLFSWMIGFATASNAENAVNTPHIQGPYGSTFQTVRAEMALPAVPCNRYFEQIVEPLGAVKNISVLFLVQATSAHKGVNLCEMGRCIDHVTCGTAVGRR
jgi:hypothetical protein